jgi:hypothetical protein
VQWFTRKVFLPVGLSFGVARPDPVPAAPVRSFLFRVPRTCRPHFPIRHSDSRFLQLDFPLSFDLVFPSACAPWRHLRSVLHCSHQGFDFNCFLVWFLFSPITVPTSGIVPWSATDFPCHLHTARQVFVLHCSVWLCDWHFHQVVNSSMCRGFLQVEVSCVF